MGADRELLELAAKAAGLESKWDRPRGNIGGWMRVREGDRWVMWNPLADDGEALRLAVELNMHCDFGNAVVTHPYEIGGEGMDRLSATRRAIVRAAAEIGKAMQ